MEAMRQSWTDDRLDEFGHRIDERFDRIDGKFEQVDQRFDRVEKEMQAGRVNVESGALRSEVTQAFEGLRAEINASNLQRQAEFHSFTRMTLQFYGVLIAALIGLLATQL